MEKGFNLEIEELLNVYLASLNKCDIDKINVIDYKVNYVSGKLIFVGGHYNVEN